MHLCNSCQFRNYSHKYHPYETKIVFISHFKEEETTPKKTYMIYSGLFSNKWYNQGHNFSFQALSSLY